MQFCGDDTTARTLRSSALLLIILGLCCINQLTQAQLDWDEDDDEYGEYYS